MRVIDGSDFVSFHGFNSASPTLRKSPVYGSCMGPSWERLKTAWHDVNAKIYSGDFVRLHLRYDDGHVECIIKELRYTRDGRWWGLCHDGPFEIGAWVKPCAIEKVVALSAENDWPETLKPASRPADEKTTIFFQTVGRIAVHEWNCEGHLAGVPFPDLELVNMAAERRLKQTGVIA